MRKGDRRWPPYVRYAMVLTCIVAAAFLGFVAFVICMAARYGDLDEGIWLGEVKATQYSRTQLAEQMRSCAEDQVVAIATSVNRNDHPWMVDVLAEEVVRLVGEGRIERAAEMVDAVAWCGWERQERVHELAMATASGSGWIEGHPAILCVRGARLRAALRTRSSMVLVRTAFRSAAGREAVSVVASGSATRGVIGVACSRRAS